MKTTYIVSGFMRTGTSMMMKALEAGGLEAAYNPNRDDMNTQFGDKYYQPNEGGFYELSREQYQVMDFPRPHWGKLIKCLWSGLPRLWPGCYKVVFMMRDPEEIRQSYEGFFNSRPPQALSQYADLMNRSIALMNVRRDTEATVFQYREVVKNPQKAFEELKNAGWEIDIKKAVEVVNPELCRFKREELTKGI